MYTQKAKIVASVIGFLLVIGGFIYQTMEVNELKEEIEKSKSDIQKLEEEQIINSDENKALSIELEELESNHLQSLEDIKTFEDLIIEKDGQIEKLEQDLVVKKEKDAEVARLAKLEQDEKAKVQQAKADKSEILSEKPVTQKTNNSVTTASSGSASADSRTFEVTHYSAYDGTQVGITRGGTNMANGNIHTSDGYRIIAVDPNTIPFGSIVEVTTSYGETFTAKADDTGGRIKGNIIDVAVSSPAEAKRLGRVSATVRIVK